MAQDNNKQSPFTRPGFVAAAVVIALIVILGLVIVIMNMTRDAPGPAPTTSASPAPTTAPDSEPAQVSEGDSVCGLPGAVTDDARLTKAPAVDQWDYAGTTAYPISAEFGPGATDPAGFRYCFQHSPEGAVVMATNAIAYGDDPEASRAWVEYAMSEGEYRDEFFTQSSTDTSTRSPDSQGSRIAVKGFRLLQYDGETARVDLAVNGSTPEGEATVSFVYELVWQGGDWKFNTDKAQPINVSPIPDSSGYVAWGP